MKVPLLALALCALTFAAGADGQPTVTVLDFKTNNVSLGDMESIVSFLSASLFDTGAFTVIDSSQRDAILKELEFSATDCTDESCQLEIGKLLSAELIIIGDIGKVGTRYMLTAKMLETETSKTVSTSKGIYADLDALLDDMGPIATRLAGLEEAAPVQQAAGKGEPAAGKDAPQGAGSQSGGETAGTAAAQSQEPVPPRPRPPRQPVRIKTLAAWSTLGLGAAGAGVGGYLIYSAMAFRADVLEPSYAAYQNESADLGTASAQDYYDLLWSAYLGNASAYKSRTVLATAVLAGGVLFLGSSVVLFLIPDAKPGPDIAVVLRPTSAGPMFGIRVGYD